MKPPQGPAGPGNVQVLEAGRRPGSKRWTLRPLPCSASPYRNHRCDIRVDELRGCTRRTRGRAPFDRRPPTLSAAKEGCRRATCLVRIRGATVGTEVQVNDTAFSGCYSMAPSSSRIAQRSDTLRDHRVHQRRRPLIAGCLLTYVHGGLARGPERLNLARRRYLRVVAQLGE